MNGTEKHIRKFIQPRVTYHATNRTFDRLFKEDSLKEMQEVVRRKLGLPDNSLVMLSQVRGGQLIDLEDDDDFDAFYAVAHSVNCVDVKVAVQQAAEPAITMQSTTSNNEEANSTVNFQTEDPSTNHRKRKVTFSENEDSVRSPSIDVDQVLPPSKRRRSNSVLKSKRPDVSQHDSVPSNDSILLPTGHSVSSNSSDEDVVVQPSPPPPTTSKAETSVTTASDTVVPNLDRPLLSSNRSLSGAYATTESKRMQKKVNKVPESINTEDKEETTSAKSGEQSERKKRKEKTKATESRSNQEITTSSEVEEKTERKRKKKKLKLDKGAPESQFPVQDPPNTLNTAEQFPQQLADAISKNADEQKREKDGKKRKKGKKSESNKIDAQPSGDLHEKGRLAPNIVVLSEQAAKTKTTNMKQKPQPTPKNDKKPEQSTESLSVTDIVRAAIRKNTELSSVSTSKLAPRVDKSTTDRSKTPVTSKIPAKPVIQASGESDSDDSIQAIRLAAQRRYIKHGEKQTLPDIDMEEDLLGPSARRLTLDNMMRVVIVGGQHKGKGVILEEEEIPIKRRSSVAQLASSDSEMEVDGGEDEDEDSRKKDESSPVLHSTSVDKAPDAVHPTISNSFTTTKADDDSQHVTNGETDEAGRANVDAEDPSNSGDSQTSSADDDPDPIEPIPSPAREPSPIQASQGEVHVSPVKGRMKKRGGTASLPSIPAPASHKRGKSISSQPVSVHEAAVRESVMKMTRSRTKLAAVNTLSRKGPSPSLAPGPQEAGAAEELQKPICPTYSLGATLPDQTDDINAPHQVWTPLDVSPPTEPESSFMMIDQLRSSAEPEPAAPLFLFSETQSSFPFSQWRDAQSQDTNGVHSPQDSQDEEEVVASVTSKRKKPSAAPTFRSLTQIANQPKMYTSPLLQPSTTPRPKAATKKELYGSVANGYGDESDSGSESEEEQSHIPKSRRAGKKSL